MSGFNRSYTVEHQQIIMPCKCCLYFVKVGEETLFEGYCQFSNSHLHPLLGRCFEELSEKSVDRLIKVQHEFPLSGILLYVHAVLLAKGRTRPSCWQSDE